MCTCYRHFGPRRLDQIKNEDVQRLKRSLEVKKPTTVNNILTVLNVMLKVALEWDVIERMPGLRLGEMVALEWADIDFVKRQLCVQRSAWKGQIASPKSGRLWFIPLTTRLAAAFRDHRHLRGSLVLYQDDGSPLTEGIVQGFVRRAAQKAGSPCVGRQRGRFKSWPDIRTSRRRSGTCS